MVKRTWWMFGGAVAVLLAVGLFVVTGSAEPGADGDEADGAEVAAQVGAATTSAVGPDKDHLPRFTEDGRLVRPSDWETWVLAGTSMGLTYAENPRTFAPGEAPGSFLHVYVQPWAYDAFMETGEFADGTMFILAGSRPVSKADPARGGFFQGDLHLMEVHLKQDGIDPTGWAFFGYGENDRSAEKIPGDASCYTCHTANADHDNVFVQFYPRIRERLGMDAAATDAPPPAAPAEGAAVDGGM